LIIRPGNPDLKQSVSHNLAGVFTKFQQEKNRNFSINLSSSYLYNQIINAVLFLEEDSIFSNGFTARRGVQVEKCVNLSGGMNFNSGIDYGFVFSPLKSRINLSTLFGFSRTPAMFNNNVSFSENYIVGPRVQLSNNILKTLSITSSYQISMGSAFNPNINLFNYYSIQTMNFTLNWRLLERLAFNSNGVYQSNAGLTSGLQQNFIVLNTSIVIKLLKSKALEASITMVDLLNQNNNITRNITEIYIEDRATNMLQRYVLFSLTYNFRKFKESVINFNE
jgi:hypothetical protein